MDARRADMVGSMRQEDVAQPTDGMEPGSEVDVVPPSAEPNVVPSGSEQPAPSPVAPTADVVGSPNSL